MGGGKQESRGVSFDFGRQSNESSDGQDGVEPRRLKRVHDSSRQTPIECGLKQWA